MYDIMDMEMCVNSTVEVTPLLMERVYMPQKCRPRSRPGLEVELEADPHRELVIEANQAREARQTQGDIISGQYEGVSHTKIDSDADMTASGFPTADELRESYKFNGILMDGRKSAQDMTNFCFEQRRDIDEGLKRMQTHQHVEIRGLTFKVQHERGLHAESIVRQGSVPVHIPGQEGSTREMSEAEAVIVRKCPSYGSESSLPMKMALCTEGEISMRVPLEICNRHNSDFDGDESLRSYLLPCPASKRRREPCTARDSITGSRSLLAP